MATQKNLTTYDVGGIEKAQALENVLKALAADKSDVRVTETNLTNSVIYNVSTSHRDFPRVLGKGRKNFMAFEHLVKLMAKFDEKEGKFVLAKPDDRTPPPRAAFVSHADFGEPELRILVSEISKHIFPLGGLVVSVPTDADTIAIELKISGDDELMFPDDEVQEALRIVFEAVGKANGKNVFLDLVRNYAGTQVAASIRR